MSVPLITVIVAGGVFLLGIILPFIVGRVDRAPERVSTPELPDADASLEIIIPAYLESSVIGPSVAQLRSQIAEWGSSVRVTVVASDQETADAAGAEGAHVIRTGREGKAAAVNFGVSESRADVILLTDANCQLYPDGWPHLLRQGLAHAHLLSANKHEIGGRESSYWKYERAVKGSQGLARPSLSMVGEFLAFRRDDYRPIDPGVLLDDINIAISFATRGLRVRVAPDIETREIPAQGKAQWERRIRISAGTWAEIVPATFRLARVPAGRQLLAHKVYRQTIGALAFWVAVLALSLTYPPISTVVVLGGTASAIALYATGVALPGILNSVATVIALQLPPILGLLRAIRPRRRSDVPGWKKIIR